MNKPKRGEIWYVSLSNPSTGRGAVGTELGAKPGFHGPYRPCVIISVDDMNKGRDRLTVVPLTHYTPGKEDTMARWTAAVNPAPHMSGHEYTVLSGRSWRRSLVDCGQLWTVFCVHPSSPAAQQLPNDVQWGGERAQLNDLALANIESGLQVVLGGCVRLVDEGCRFPDLPFQEGDVFEVDLPGQLQQRCLVVSSTSVDYLRECITRRDLNPHRPLGHVTVVPLLPVDSDTDLHDAKSVASVDVGGSRGLAVCQEIYTIDWRSRKATRPKGSVSPLEMVQVRKALRMYLDLPLGRCSTAGSSSATSTALQRCSRVLMPSTTSTS